MSLAIVWSPASKDEYAAVLDYVEQNFGLDSALKLLDKTDSVLSSIAEFPNMYKSSKKRKDVKKAIITKKVSVFYQVSNQEIQILHFWDNRQNPTKEDNLF